MLSVLASPSLKTKISALSYSDWSYSPLLVSARARESAESVACLLTESLSSGREKPEGANNSNPSSSAQKSSSSAKGLAKTLSMPQAFALR